MEKTIKILMLEDSPTDAEMIQHLLTKSNLDCTFCLTSDKESFKNELKEFSPDIILSDNSLPRFNATEALTIVKLMKIDVPFIIVTGTMSEEFAASTIKLGTDDYIIKDRMARLPAAIEATLRQHLSDKEKKAALQKVVESEKHYRTFVERVSDGFISLDIEMNITYINSVAEIMLSKPRGFLLNKNLVEEFPSGAGGHLMEMSKTALKSGVNIHREYYSEVLSKWVFTSVYPSDTGISVFFRDITEKKKLESDLKEQQEKEHIRLTANTLDAQEKERNVIGIELHDNVNQILVGTSMFLSILKDKPEKIGEIVPWCIEKINSAIEENRRIAHELVTPDMNTESLLQRISGLCLSMLQANGMKFKINEDIYNESLLNNNQKLMIYRIAQEQCTNIIKYSKAKNVQILLSTMKDNKFNMRIADDGQGMAKDKVNKDGIGLRNIAGRVSILNGSMKIDSQPGAGYILEIEIPLD
jgi:two-component system, NarL family, sensor histidine kinase UhpB